MSIEGGGVVWVFLLATIVSLPLAAAGRGGVTRGEGARHRTWDTSTIVLTVAVWACTLPVVSLLVAPLLGLRAAALTAAALLGVMTVVCWAVCLASAAGERRATEARRP
jgi:hypothetical protein